MLLTCMSVATQHENPSAAAELRALRARARLTQEEVADGTGTHVSTIQRLEARGVGHNLRRVREFLLARQPVDSEDGTPVTDPRISDIGVNSAVPAAMYFALAKALEGMPVDEQARRVGVFAQIYEQIKETTPAERPGTHTEDAVATAMRIAMKVRTMTAEQRDRFFGTFDEVRDRYDREPRKK